MRSFIIILGSLVISVLLLHDFNPGNVTVNVLPSRAYEISMTLFFVISMGIGAACVFILYFLRDVKRFLRGLRVQREQKKRLKIQDLYASGLNALLAKKNAEAKAYFLKVLALDPDHVDSLLRLGITQVRDKNYDDAIASHQRALRLAPGNQEVLFSLAADYEEAKRFEDALALYQSILSRDASNLTALNKMRDLYQRMNRWESLSEVQRKLLALPLAPGEQETERRRLIGFRYELGRQLLESGDPEKASKIFRAIIKLDRDFIPAYLGLGETHLESGKTNDAAELWEKAFKTTSSVLLLLRLEDLYLKQGEPGKAIEMYNRTLDWKKKDTELTFFLGKLYYRLEMIDEAFDTLSSVDWGDKDFPDVHKLLGNIYLRRGSLGLAAVELKKALGFKKQVIVPYTCSSCDLRTTDWSGRCPNCGKWNTFGMNLEKNC
jgi:lipopolysaccharide biosynthesis regulator YciM